eukprot:scaffold1085_cov407-Prasinococcus_capsulatus_cf.AAC.72
MAVVQADETSLVLATVRLIGEGRPHRTPDHFANESGHAIRFLYPQRHPVSNQSPSLIEVPPCGLTRKHGWGRVSYPPEIARPPACGQRLRGQKPGLLLRTEAPVYEPAARGCRCGAFLAVEAVLPCTLQLAASGKGRWFPRFQTALLEQWTRLRSETRFVCLSADRDRLFARRCHTSLEQLPSWNRPIASCRGLAGVSRGRPTRALQQAVEPPRPGPAGARWLRGLASTRHGV